MGRAESIYERIVLLSPKVKNMGEKLFFFIKILSHGAPRWPKKGAILHVLPILTYNSLKWQ